MKMIKTKFQTEYYTNKIHDLLPFKNDSNKEEQEPQKLYHRKFRPNYVCNFSFIFCFARIMTDFIEILTITFFLFSAKINEYKTTAYSNVT